MAVTVLCPSCRRRIVIPPEKAGTPNLRARCGGCQQVFAVAEAAIAPALAPAAPTPAPAAPPAPASSPAAPRPAAPQAPSPAALPRTGPPAVPSPVSGAASAPSAARPRSAPRGWRRCANHPASASEAVCPQCGRGLCGACVNRQGQAAICPQCDALCVPAAEQDRREALARRRARPLSSEIGTVLRYPLTDKMSFVLLAVFVGVFALAASIAVFGGGFAALVSQGLLYAYAFSAINRVSSGELSGFMPQLDDWTDLLQPVRAGLAALLISSGPLLALTLAYSWQELASSVGAGRVAALAPAEPSPSPSPTLDPRLAALVEDEAAGEAAAGEDVEAGTASGDEERATVDPPEPPSPGVPAWAIAAFFAALLWKLVYSPIALVAAAISRSFLATLNPLAGLDAIRRMGGTYWSAMGVYTVLVLVSGTLGLLLSLVPFVGKLLVAFVDSYAYLAIGCLLGLAVFKKAAELNLD
jgi:hypothetical protein